MSTKYLVRTVGLALVAALAVAAVASSAAFGASEFKANKAFPISFKGTGNAARFESDGSGLSKIVSVVSCEKSSSEGSVVSSKEAKVTVSYSGKCKVTGGATGTCTEPIKTEELKAEPVEIGGTGTKRGLLFKPVTGTVLAKLTCAGQAITVEGELICESSPIGKLSTTATITCKEEESAGKEVPGEQLFTMITGSSTEHLLKATAFFTNEEDAQITTETLKYEPAGTEVEQT